MKMRNSLTTAVVIVLVALAQESDSAYWVYDKVVSVETAESAIKVTDAKGKNPRRITLTPFTQIIVNTMPGKLEDIKSGMWVETTCTSGNMASRINVMDPRGGTDAPAEKVAKSTPKGLLYNKVESVNVGDSTITVAEMDGKTLTYTVTQGTLITVYGNPGKLEDIKSGMKVVMSATVAKIAGRIDAMDPPGTKAKTLPPSRRLNLFERVFSVNPAEYSLTVTRADGQNRRTIMTSAFTKIMVYDKLGKLEDIKSGMKVYVSCTSGNMATRIDAMDISPDEVDPSAETKK